MFWGDLWPEGDKGSYEDWTRTVQKDDREMASLMRKATLLLAALALSAAPVAARADSTSAARAEAKKHYDRAMELNEDGQTAEAIIELKRCYELAPHHTVLYNLGQAYITLAQPLKAVAALQGYLDEGGKDIKPVRRAEVEQEIARQKTRIATLQILVLPDGARVRVNGVDVGAAPLSKPIPVGIGDHVVSASADGYDPAEVQVTVAGEDRRTVELTLKPRPVQTGCALGYHDGGTGSCVAAGVCSAGYHNDGRGVCVAVGCGPGYLLVRAQCVLGFRSVSSGGIHTCGVMTDGAVTCWGDRTWGAATPPAGTFASVSAGRYHTCGVNSRGGVACWGKNNYGQAAPSAGTFASVSAGYWHTCAVKTDGTVACWGYNADGQATPPAGTFVSVSAGEHHTCGVKTDGTVACWGRKVENQSAAPAGTFASVSAGQYHTCGVKRDGTITCWGYNDNNESTPPPGRFASVSAGHCHSCGVRSDGSIACWGRKTEGQTTPPAGTFAAVSAGYWHTCGVRTDSSVACWGGNTSH